MAAPYAGRDVELEIEGDLVSAPYVTMTLSTMEEFGVRAERDGDRRFRVASGQHYAGRRYAVEPDASGASYFFAAAAVTGGHVVVPRLGNRSAQGDLGLLDVLARMGCEVTIEADAIAVQGPARLRAVEADFTRMGDVATTLMAIAPFADGPVTVRGVRLKEADGRYPVSKGESGHRVGQLVHRGADPARGVNGHADAESARQHAERIGDVFTVIGRGFQKIVDLFQLDEDDGIFLFRKQLGHGFANDPVRLVLQPVDLDAVHHHLGHVLVKRFESLLQAAGALFDDLAQFQNRRRDRFQVGLFPAEAEGRAFCVGSGIGSLLPRRGARASRERPARRDDGRLRRGRGSASRG